MRALALALLIATPALADDLHYGHGWMAATDADTARAFVSLENEGSDAVTIVGFRADWAAAALVGSPIRADGLDVPLPEYPLLAGETLDMEPDTVFIRLTGISEPLPKGEEREITLVLASGKEHVIEIEVESADAEESSHAGHNH